LAAGNELTKRSATLEADLDRLREGLLWLRSHESYDRAGQQREVSSALQATRAFFPSKRTKSMNPWFEPVRSELHEYRQFLAGLAAESLAGFMNVLLDQFDQQYNEAKRHRGVLDFTDLELKALELVREAGSDGGRRLFGPRARVMIDEFQDTNELQCAILEGLGAERLLMVGDERQSIYRFRGADVRVFRRREAELARSSSGLHLLAMNYRSSAGVLDFVNRLFGSEVFFGSRLAGLEHGRDDGAAETGGHALLERAVDVLLVARDDVDDPDASALAIQDVESRAVAWQVRRLIDVEGLQPRDIAILTPALTHSDTLQSELANSGIASYLVRGKGYYSREEVADILAMIRVLVNPHDDLALVTVLRSPFAALSDDALYLIGMQARKTKRSLWQIVQTADTPGLEQPDAIALERFTTNLTQFWRRVGRPGIAGLIDDLIYELGYDVCMLSSDEGNRRFANVRKLMRLADEYESLEGPNLAGFIELVRGMGDLADSEGSAPTLAEGENVVRIMTVHQAKGLEFPAVLLMGLGSAPRNEHPGQFVTSSDGRVGVVLKDSRNKSYEDEDLSWGPAPDIIRDNRVQEYEEDGRLLYVAMTRAKERLILVGALTEGGKFENTRIARVLSGLGLECPPGPEQVLDLDELSAAVHCLAPSAVVGSCGELTGSAGETRSDGLPRCSEFLPSPRTAMMPRRLSYSALSGFDRCPRSFYLESVLGLRLSIEDVSVGLGASDTADGRESETVLDVHEATAGRETGLLVHGLLEKLPLAGPVPELSELVSLTSQVVAADAAAFRTNDLDRAFDLVRAFWQSEFSMAEGIGRAQKEVSFCFAQQGLIFSGVMDLVFRENGAWTIVDYKTNSLNGRDPADLAEEYLLQGQIYSLVALRAGAKSVAMNLLFLESPGTPVGWRYSPQDQDMLADALNSRLAEIRRSAFPAKPGSICRRCCLQTLC
jgi:ATP-dependent helicase/nuclease subunit A